LMTVDMRPVIPGIALSFGEVRTSSQA
jgi:hypothetical protein